MSNICGQQIKIAQTGEKDPGTRMGNLKKHLQRQHPDVYEVVQSQALTRTASGKQQVQGQKKVDSFFAPAPEKVLVRHNMESFKAALVEMAVDNAFSLRVSQPKVLSVWSATWQKSYMFLWIKTRSGPMSSSLPMLRRTG